MNGTIHARFISPAAARRAAQAASLATPEPPEAFSVGVVEPQAEAARRQGGGGSMLPITPPSAAMALFHSYGLRRALGLAQHIAAEQRPHSPEAVFHDQVLRCLERAFVIGKMENAQ